MNYLILLLLAASLVYVACARARRDRPVIGMELSPRRPEREDLT